MISFPSEKEMLVILAVLITVPFLVGLGLGWIIWS